MFRKKRETVVYSLTESEVRNIIEKFVLDKDPEAIQKSTQITLGNRALLRNGMEAFCVIETKYAPVKQSWRKEKSNMINSWRNHDFICDGPECDAIKQFNSTEEPGITIKKAIQRMRDLGWAVNANLYKCYCPKCKNGGENAIFHEGDYQREAQAENTNHP